MDSDGGPAPRGYTGYRRRVVPSPDDELTRGGPDTPAGEWLRPAWQPVCLASQIAERPLAIRILGEDLVAFRDGAGRVGVLHRHCSHRGASLEFGVVMERGISCCYHGWHYDIDGRILDTPGEPPGSRIKDRLCHGAYPAREFRGLVFAWLGPPEAMTEFPHYDVYDEHGVEALPFLLSIPCNWLQVYENSQDPVHVVFLHTRMSGAQFDPSHGAMQEIDYRETPLGMMNVQTRRIGERVWTRTVECILPNGNQTGAIWEKADREKTLQRSALMRWTVPVDDTHTLVAGWRFCSPALDPDGQGDRDRIGLERIDFVGQTEDRPYAERQRQPGDYDAQVSQRPIAIHALENLASSDRGVAMLRRLIRRAIRRHGAGEAAASPARAGPIATYTQDTVSALPPRDGDDRALLRAHGSAVADALLGAAGEPAVERGREIERRVRAL